MRWISSGERPVQAARNLLLRRRYLGALRIDDFKFASTSSLRAGRARKSPPTCPSWSIFGRTRLSARPVSAASSGLTRVPLVTATTSTPENFRRLVMVQQYVAKLAGTAISFPPMQAPASFNLEAVEAKRRGDDQEPRRSVKKCVSGVGRLLHCKRRQRRRVLGGYSPPHLFQGDPWMDDVRLAQSGHRADALQNVRLLGMADRGPRVEASPRSRELPEGVFGCSGVNYFGFLDRVE